MASSKYTRNTGWCFDRELVLRRAVPKLRSFNLNLLVTFESIYRHGCVSDAADELCLSQSAVSHALAQLREIAANPLFIRSASFRGNPLTPTPAADALYAHVSAGLNALRDGMASLAEQP